MIAARPLLLERWRRFWHEYTRMRTAIFFLIGIVLIVLIGSFVPQDGTSDPGKVQTFLETYPTLDTLATRLGLPLTDVFVSPVFYVLLGSLYIALGACVLRRGRALVVRTVRRYPRTPQYWGEWGSWAFHTAFFLLLIAVVWGKATGYQGLVAVTEGQSFTDSRGGYDQLQEGLLFNGQHAGFTLHLDRFSASYQADGEASDYVSDVTVFQAGRPVVQKAIRVNDFLSYDGVNVYQQDYGWAPVLVVRNPSGAVVFDSPIQFFGEDKTQQTGVLKVPDFDYTIPGASKPVQIGARLAFFPDAQQLTQIGNDGPMAVQYAPGGEEARNPVVEMQLFVGDLGLNSGTPQNVNALDTDNMQPYFSDAHVLPIGLGGTQTLVLPGSNGQQVPFTITFAALHQYSLFQVSKDSGVPLVYATFFLVMAGLLTKLYLRPLLERRQQRRRPRAVQLSPVWTEERSHVAGVGGR